MLLMKLILHELNGNFQIVACFVNAHYHETCISPTPITYATYWALAHSTLQQFYK